MKRFRSVCIGCMVVLAGCAGPGGDAAEPSWERLSVKSASSAAGSIPGEETAPASVPPAPVSEPAPTAELPTRVQLDVPFMVQAPTGNWDDPYQEACEEASLLMAHAFLQGIGLTVEDADRDLLALINWETQNGFGQDVTIAELADIAERYYGYRARIETDVTVSRIKELLAAGSPVIVPAAGRDLGNPYFSGEGPWYHMLVITGYDPRYFVTNDPGTRRGEDYKYDHATLLSAVHDWTGVKEEIHGGRKVMLVVSRP